MAPFQNVADAVEFLCSTFAKKYIGPSNVCQIMSCIFWNVELYDVDRSQTFGCAIMDNFRKMYSISSLDHLDPKLLLICELNCFYPTCVDWSDEDDCDFRSHVKPCKTIKLIPTERSVARSMLDDNNFQLIWGGDG